MLYERKTEIDREREQVEHVQRVREREGAGGHIQRERERGWRAYTERERDDANDDIGNNII